MGWDNDSYFVSSNRFMAPRCELVVGLENAEERAVQFVREGEERADVSRKGVVLWSASKLDVEIEDYDPAEECRKGNGWFCNGCSNCEREI